jgi:hypothetical protein
VKTIKLHTPLGTEDNETQTEYDVEDILNITSVVGNDAQEGTNFWVRGSGEKQFCVEPASVVRAMIADAKSKEEVDLEPEGVRLVLAAAKSDDGAIHFIDSGGVFTVMVADRQQTYQGRQRVRYNHVRQKLELQGFIQPKGDGLYEITERAYVLADFLAEHHSGDDTAFHGYVKLPGLPAKLPVATTYNIVNSHVEQLTDSGHNQKG